MQLPERGQVEPEEVLEMLQVSLLAPFFETVLTQGLTQMTFPHDIKTDLELACLALSRP